jgi:photosystem II 13kDa protein
MATLQFYRGTDETVVPKVKITRSKDGSKGTASFVFENPNALSGDSIEGITGLYMVDEEGEISTKDVNARFINGQAFALEALYIIRSPAEWDRFIRFMERYSEANGMGLTKKEE